MSFHLLLVSTVARYLLLINLYSVQRGEFTTSVCPGVRSSGAAYGQSFTAEPGAGVTLLPAPLEKVI